MELNGKIAVVTGVSKGIGLCITRELLDAGAIVAGWGRSSPQLGHSNFHFFETDVRDESSVNNSFRNTVDQLGDEVAILVNNAGTGSPALLEETPPEKWREMFETNVNGVFYCSRLVIPLMKKLGKGHIVNIASIAGTMGTEKLSAYCGTKFALRGITQALYKELRPFGIKVTSVCPGSVKTHFFDEFPDVVVNDSMLSPEDIATSVIQLIRTAPNFHVVELEVRPLQPRK